MHKISPVDVNTLPPKEWSGAIPALVADHLPCVVAHLDAQGRCQSGNQRLRQWLALPVGQRLAGRQLSRLLDAASGQALEKALAQAAASRRPADYAGELRVRGHAARRVEATCVPVLDTQGAIHRFYWLMSDVTEQHRLAQQLRASEQRFKDITEASADWTWEMNERFEFCWLSKASAEPIGLRAADFVGRTRWGLFAAHGQWHEPVQWERHRQVHLAQQPYQDFIAEWRHPDGTSTWFSISGKPIVDEHGTFRGYRGSTRDVTARVLAERALAASEARFRALADLGADWFWEQDADGRGENLLHQALLGRLHHQRAGGGDVEFLQQRRAALLHGPLGDVQRGRDVAVELALGDQEQNLALARRERQTRWCWLAARADKPAGDLALNPGAEIEVTGHYRLDRPDQLLGDIEFDEVAVGTGSQRQPHHRRVGIVRHHQDFNRRQPPLQLLGQIIAAPVRQIDIEEQHIGLLGQAQRSRLLAVGGNPDDVEALAVLLQMGRDQLRHQRLVFGNQDTNRCRHPSSALWFPFGKIHRGISMTHLHGFLTPCGATVVVSTPAQFG
jgi:PAS domain S-box-containing protein